MASTEDALIVHEQRALAGPEAMKAMQEQAKQVFLSGLCPKSVSKWEQVLVISLYGRELGLPMIRALNEIHVIDGHPGISSKLMNIKVRENLPNAIVDVLEKTDKICRISFQRSPKHKAVVISYTWDEANKAGLTGKNNWKNHPVDMLFARCFSRMVREECPEVVCGFVYTPEIAAGWSPDGLIDDDGALEIKWHTPAVMVGILDKGTMPTKHRAQCHGGMLVGRRRWLDLVLYSHPKMPKAVFRLEADPIYQRQIQNEIEKFNWERDQLLKKMRAMMS